MILWINPFAGISGDMFLAALLDLGAPINEVRSAIEATALTGWSLTATRVDVSGIRATRLRVEIDDDAHSRPAAELRRLVQLAGDDASIAVAAIDHLASVEASLHGTQPDQVLLHEVGGLDTVIDVVGTAAALRLLDIEQVFSAPVVLGSGEVDTRHGTIPLPAPAAMELLRGASVVGTDRRVETVTPTGAALLRAANTRFGSMPMMTVASVGYGAGTRDDGDYPNVLQAVLGSPNGGVGRAVLLETNVDDVTGEVLGYVLMRLLALGAADVWVTPIVMKKGRPAHTVHVLTDTHYEDALGRALLDETGSLGLRRTEIGKAMSPRTVTEVSVADCVVRIKSSPRGAKPEYDDLVAAAGRLDLPIREVARRAMMAFEAL